MITQRNETKRNETTTYRPLNIHQMERDCFGISKAEDCYPWAKDIGAYLSPDELESRLLDHDKSGSVLVVDVRDDDAVGGNIKGALHLWDSSDWENVSMPRLITEIATRKPDLVVFHCMESLRRGPRCAKRLFTYLQINERLDKHPDIRILTGGADRWIRKHYKNPALVENFCDDYWGFTDLLDESSTDNNNGHVLYEAPVDKYSR